MRNKSIKNLKRLPVVLMVMILSALLLCVNCSKKKFIKKKQVILISVDTLRGDHLSPYGYSRDTSPNLSRLVNDSVYYTKAYPNGCWTMPSHICLLTGTLPSWNGINRDWQSFMSGKYPKLKNSIKTLAEIFKTRDLKTVKFANLPDELGFSRGFEKNNKIDPFANKKILKTLLLELEKNKDEDFFFFIHTWRVHLPYSNSYFLKEGRLGKEKRHDINNFRSLTEQGENQAESFKTFLKENNLFNTEDCITLYDSCIRYVDRNIGKIIDETKRLGIYDDLMFIVVSDHGEHFEEHYADQFCGIHGTDFYEEFILVPVIIKYPRRYKQGIIDHPVSLVDILPTVCDYYNIKPPDYVQGESLLLAKPDRSRKYIISEAISVADKERKMIRVGDLKYIITMQNPSQAARVNWQGIIQRRLFDLKNDPLEKYNLCREKKFRKIRIELEKMLSRILAASAKMNLSMEETEISGETLEHLKSLGYIE